MKSNSVTYWAFMSGWLVDSTLNHLLRGEFSSLWVDILLLSICVWNWVQESRR